MGKSLAAAVMTCVLAGAAAAAPDWTMEKLSFAPRDGWCPTHTVLGETQTLEARPCEEDFPALSLVISQSKAPRQDLARLAAAEAAKARDTQNQVLETVQARAGGECTDNSFAVQPSPMPGVAGFAVVASYQCTSAEDEPALFNIFTAYAQGRDGSIWTLRFDHPGTPLSDRDRAMIKAVIAKISGR